ncbi:hypothetical protein F5141DRAFT_1293335 [Pisolithus sp. B1]|nr:hypothetical protein F5141DRAFT_1293335 [Pisolithus sp. B1]
MAKWRNDYGSIMHLEVFGKHMIVLNSAQAARDLMDKRAAIYSHRPRMPMLIDLVGNSWVRYFLGQFKDWQHVQLKSSRTFLRNLFDDPDNWVAFLPFSGQLHRLSYRYAMVINFTDARRPPPEDCSGCPGSSA